MLDGSKNDPMRFSLLGTIKVKGTKKNVFVPYCYKVATQASRGGSGTQGN